MAPGLTPIVVEDVTALPSIVPLTVVDEPESRPVKEAVYVPLPTSVVLEIVPVLVPLLLVNTTVLPPVVMLLLFASRANSVSVAAVPEFIVDADVVISEVAVEIGPGVTANVGSVVVTALPSIVAVTCVADPEINPENEAV